jgi:hypothetical protein
MPVTKPVREAKARLWAVAPLMMMMMMMKIVSDSQRLKKDCFM